MDPYCDRMLHQIGQNNSSEASHRIVIATSFETMLFIDLIFLITFSQIMELPLLSPMCDNCPRNMELIISNPFLLSSREWPD